MRNFEVKYGHMIPRPEPIHQIQASFRVHPITALLGPRQCDLKAMVDMGLVISQGATKGFMYVLCEVRRIQTYSKTSKGYTGNLLVI